MPEIVLTKEEARLLTPLFYHKCGEELARRMEDVRTHYIDLGARVLRSSLVGRSRALALTHLEDSCMRAIQAIALEGEIIVPATVILEPF